MSPFLRDLSKLAKLPRTPVKFLQPHALEFRTGSVPYWKRKAEPKYDSALVATLHSPFLTFWLLSKLLGLQIPG
jgi:hypothetical protein